ncbi:hypothetical protein [Rhizobium yanglingense]
MTKIFYETFPVAQVTFEGEWRLEYDPILGSAPLGFPHFVHWLRTIRDCYQKAWSNSEQELSTPQAIALF